MGISPLPVGISSVLSTMQMPKLLVFPQVLDGSCLGKFKDSNYGVVVFHVLPPAPMVQEVFS